MEIVSSAVSKFLDGPLAWKVAAASAAVVLASKAVSSVRRSMNKWSLSGMSPPSQFGSLSSNRWESLFLTLYLVKVRLC